MLLIAIGILLAANESRDATDSAIIDKRVWEVDHRGWRRLPSCGELRQGK